MDRNFTLHTTINRSRATVFQAVTDEKYLELGVRALCTAFELEDQAPQDEAVKS